jgi:hypothetical protein
MAKSMIAKINNYIQRRLQQENLDAVSLKEAATWLAGEGILKDSGSSPGYPLRRHVKKGNIIGICKKDQKYWIITRLKNYKELLDPSDLKAIFDLKSRTSLYRKIKREKIPYIKKENKRIFFQESELLKWALEKGKSEIFQNIQDKRWLKIINEVNG